MSDATKLAAMISKKLGDLQGEDGIITTPTGFPSLDVVLGGGLAPGVVEFSGAESSGKTTLAFAMAAQILERSPETFVGIVDTEFAVNPEYTQVVGLDVRDRDRVIYFQPDSAEDALRAIYMMVNNDPAPSLVILDSVAALNPMVYLEDEGDVSKAHMAAVARVLTTHLRQVVPIARRKGIPLIYINQHRAKIDTSGGGYGAKVATPGGFALRYFAWQRVTLTRTTTAQQVAAKGGMSIKFRVTKNKVGQPFQHTEIYLDFEAGIDPIASTIEAAIDLGIVQKNGAMYSYGDLKFRGRASFVEAVLNDSLLVADLQTKVQEKLA